ncbi:MAG: polyphosphate polymerase domain-containing protein [Oligoflexia bacterium]|nr:polyphosphate polymerase domain-containing protein [Oligoflexia bacterium]
MAASISGASARPVDTGLLRRFEDKYFVAAELREELLAFLRARLAPNYAREGTRFNLIESVYFDSDRLELFRQHFDSPLRRFKVRTRRYAPDGVWAQSGALIELKAKEGKISDKTRFHVDEGDLRGLFAGRPIEPGFLLRRRNAVLRKKVLLQRVALVNAAIAEHALRPRMRIVYRRHAFEKEGVRVTVDDQLSSELVAPLSDEVSVELRASARFPQAQSMRRRFQSAPLLICEVKHGREVPLWLRDFLVGKAGENVRFSKYCYAVAGALSE